MNRIGKKFTELKAQKKKALIVYLTAGDPSLKKTGELVLALEKDGVDLIELGVPFSDPLADGPVIQAASNRSLEHGTTLAKILDLVGQIRKNSQIPLLLMSYLNPILGYGYEKFAKEAKAKGVDGVIIPDLPPDEEISFAKTLKKTGLSLVYLLAPTSTDARTKMIANHSKGFVYYVSMTGVTGSKVSLSATLGQKISQAKRASKNPVCVGFGISDPAQAKEAAKTSDGVIVGSAVVKALNQNGSLSAEAFSKKFIRPFSRALGKN